MIDRYTMAMRLIREHDARIRRIQEALNRHAEDSFDAWHDLAQAAGVDVVELRAIARESNEDDGVNRLPRRTT